MTEYIGYLDEDHAPVVDMAQEVVRCRDCEHMHTVRSWYSDNLVDECWLHASHENALGRYYTEPDGFCAWGERRES